MTTPTDDSTDSATERPVTNKRTADRQITKDDCKGDDDDDNDDDDNDGHPMDKTEQTPTGSFPRADAATLATRKMVKIKKPSSETTASPFAAVFGSGFASTASNGFGGGFEFATTSATVKSGFGSAFGGPAATTSAFGTIPVSIFGIQREGEKTPPPKPLFLPVDPNHADVTNGEDGELLLHEVRAKTFELVEEEDVVTTQTSDGPIPASNSIPLSNLTHPTATVDTTEKPDKTNDEATEGEPTLLEGVKETSTKEDVEINTSENTANSADNVQQTEPETKKKTKWREVGIGPLRVLKKDHARIVQRRETAPGSLGTKLMVNIQLRQECTITRPSDKHVQLGAIMNGKAASFLFKVKNVSEAQLLQDLFAKEIDQASP
jgi:NUP50 (Nucleoporin 50 kDa)